MKFINLIMDRLVHY